MKITSLALLGILGASSAGATAYVSAPDVFSDATAEHVASEKDPIDSDEARNRDAEGMEAPDINLKGINGKRVDLSTELKKGPVLVYFSELGTPSEWLRDMQKLYDYGASTQKFGVIVVNCTDEKDSVKSYMKAQKYTFPVGLARGTDVCDSYGLSETVNYSTVAIREDGSVGFYFLGGRSHDFLSRVMDQVHDKKVRSNE